MSLQPVIRSLDAAIDDANRADRTITARVNTDALDRYNSIIDPRGAKLDNYRRSGILLWEHGRDGRRGTDPLGRALWIKPNSPTNPTAILAKFRFLEDPFADERYRWYVDGILDSFSVRALPLSYRQPTRSEIAARPELDNDRPNETGQFVGPLIYDSWELGEVSATAVAGNPECIAIERALSLVGLADAGKLWLPDDARPAIEARARSVAVAVPRATTDSEGGLAGGGATVGPDDAPAAEGERFLPADPGAVSASAPGEARAADAGGDGESHAITREPDGWYAHCDRCLGGPYPTAERAAAHSCGEILRDDMGEMADDGGGMAMDMGMGDMPATGAARSSEGEHRPGPHKPTHGVKKRGKKWVVVANSGRLMGEYASKEEAENRVREIEYFKHEGRSAPDAGPAAADDLAAQLERLRSGAVPTLSDVMRLEMLRFRNWGADRDDAIRAERDLRDRGIV